MKNICRVGEELVQILFHSGLILMILNMLHLMRGADQKNWREYIEIFSIICEVGNESHRLFLYNFPPFVKTAVAKITCRTWLVLSLVIFVTYIYVE